MGTVKFKGKTLWAVLLSGLVLILFTTACQENDDYKAQGIKGYGKFKSPQWEWCSCFITEDDSRIVFVCNKDSASGGYVAAINEYGFNSHNAICYELDEHFTIKGFSFEGYGPFNVMEYVVTSHGNTMYVTGLEDGRLSHYTYSYENQRANCLSSNPYAACAISISGFNEKVDILNVRIPVQWKSLIEKTASGGYDNAPTVESSVTPGYNDVTRLDKTEQICNYIFGKSVIFINNSEFNYGKSKDGNFYATVEVQNAIPEKTFNRNPAKATYGSSVENKVYYGLLIGDDIEVNTYNALYNVKGGEVRRGEKTTTYTFQLPKLASGIYYLRAYLASEDEYHGMESGDFNPRMLRYAGGSKAYCALEASLNGVEMTNCLYDNSGVMADFEIDVVVPKIPYSPIHWVESSWGIAYSRLGNDFSESSVYGRTEGFSGNLAIGIGNLYREDFKLDYDNYRATLDMEILLYCYVGNEKIILDRKPCTIVYDKKPKLRYVSAELVQDTCTINHVKLEDAILEKSIISGAFWFDSDIEIREANGKEDYFMAEIFSVDYGKFSSVKFYKHFYTNEQKSTKKYMRTILNGQEFRSNELHYTWSEDRSKIISVEVSD